MDEKTEDINEETIQQRAKEAVAVFAKEAVTIFLEGWEDTPEAQMVERGGEHFLIFKPSDPLMSYASLHINLEERCEKLLTSMYEKFRTENPGGVFENLYFTNRLARRLPLELTCMATSAPNFLNYSVCLLDLLMYRERVQSLSNILDQDVQAYAERLAGLLSYGLLLQHNLAKKRKRGAPSVIDEGKVLEVLLRFRGETPSIRLLAKELNTGPAIIRGWLRKKGFKSLQELSDDMVNSFKSNGRLTKKETGRKG